MQKHFQILRAERVRNLEAPFAWIPFRFLSEGFMQKLSPNAKLLYFFLCLVSDHRGLSYYGNKRICVNTGISISTLTNLRKELIQYDLLAFADGVYQLLSLPTKIPERAQTQNETQQSKKLERIRDILQKLSSSHQKIL